MCSTRRPHGIARVEFWVALFAAFACLIGVQRASAAPVDLEPHVQATVSTAPPAIDLRWQAMAGVRNVRISRRDAVGDLWVTRANLTATATSYRDTAVAPNRTYEYRVAVRNASGWVYGYLTAGIEVMPPVNRGTVLIAIDPTISFSQSDFWNALWQWEADLWEDGWYPAEVFIPTFGGVTPASVKARLAQDLQYYPAPIHSIVLVGHLPVVHSGNIRPDQITAHSGAWPADQWYGDNLGTWTDTQALGGAFRPNIAGDGRFDQNVLPAIESVPVARIDPAGLNTVPGAALTAYFERNHARRVATTDSPTRTLLTDPAQTGSTRAIFGASTALGGSEPVVAADFLGALDDPAGYALAMASGRTGTASSLAGLASSADFATRTPHATILGLDGPWLGDWDIPQNVLTAALFSAGTVQNALWFDRPTARMHGLGAMQSVGDVFRATMTNPGTDAAGYTTRGTARSVHLALLGDPTVRVGPKVAPPTDVVATLGAGHVRLSWTASTSAAVSGYVVDRMSSSDVTWKRLTPAPITSTSYTDPFAGAFTGASYRVVAVKLVTTGSGTFYADAGMSTYASPPSYPNRAIPITLRAAIVGGIDLTWPAAPGPVQAFSVERRLDGVGAWQRVTPAEGILTNGWVDASAQTGTRYEYRVRDLYGSSTGVIMGGVDAVRPDDEGVVLLVVDSTKATALSSELSRLDRDLVEDGWTVRRIDVNPGDTPANVKSRIQETAGTSSGRLRAAFLLGAVPRVFSGCQFPDGHPDHYGAWPADGFYADLDGVWTDTTTCGVGAFVNQPGDGKYDQTQYPTSLDIAVGRVDTEGLPAFAPLTSTDLLRRWLDRNHGYRTGADVPAARAIYSDQIGELRTDTVAAGTALFGTPPLDKAQSCARDGIVSCPADLVDLLGDPQGYAYAVGSGGGTPVSASGVGSTTDFVTKPAHVTFFGIFGSYHGDWSYQDNLMRAALVGPGTVQGTLWAGRPNVLAYRLAALDTFGEMVRASGDPQTRNNSPVYQGLLGDPTLHLASTAAPTDATWSSSGSTSILLNWITPSQPGTLGTVIYRRTPEMGDGPWVRVTPTPIAGTSFVDTPGQPGNVEYRLVTVRRLQNGAGTFLDRSRGVIVAAVVD